MAWWHRFIRRPDRVLAGGVYRIPFRLYSKDGKRGVEVRERDDGTAYFVEQEWVEGTTFKYRRPGKEIGPFESTAAAEAAAIATPWFNGSSN
jgi:hypothetical protein